MNTNSPQNLLKTADRHPLKVIVCAGQSNMAGDGDIAELPEAYGNLIVRIFNPTGAKVKTELSVLDKINTLIKLSPFEIKTFKINPVTNIIIEVQGVE